MVGVVRSLASGPFVLADISPASGGKPLFFPLWIPACAGMTGGCAKGEIPRCARNDTELLRMMWGKVGAGLKPAPT